MGSKVQQQTTQQTTTPANQAALQNIYGTVANAAATPYTPYTGQLVAGINGQQTAGINTINAGANAAQPYYAQAGQLASSAANPLTSSEIQQFQNPYTQNVVNATQAQFNDQNGQQQNSLKGAAAQQGALGGDRQAVAQAQLAGQQQLAQAPTIANLYANSYNSGLQTAAQQYQQNPLAAAASLGNIGTGAENAALAGGSAQIGAGTLQQQTQQAQDTANYGQYQAAQAYPYQNAAFLEQYGLPAALGQGSTSNGTQTTQGPTTLASILGAGTLGLGALGNSNVQAGLGSLGSGLGSLATFLKDGGAVSPFAAGGSVGYVDAPAGYILSNQGYIPKTQPSNERLQTPPPHYMQPPQQTNPASVLGALGGSTSKNPFAFGSSVPGAVGPTSVGGPQGPAPLNYAVGGLVDAIHSIHRTIKRSRGGSVTGSTPFDRFDDGGTVPDDPFGDANRAAGYDLLRQGMGTTAPASIPGGEPAPAVQPDVINPDSPYRMPDAGAVQAWRDGADHPNPAVVADTGMPDASVTGRNPMINPARLPSPITNPDNVPAPTSMAYGDTGSGISPVANNYVPKSDGAQSSSSSPFGGFHLSDNASLGLMAAGLGILGSPSHFASVAVGQGGLQGLAAYSNANKADQEAADRAVTQRQNQQRIDQEAERLHQQLQDSVRAAQSAPLVPGPGGKLIPNQPLLAYEKAKADINSKDNWQPIGSVVSGDTVHPLVQNRADGTIKDAVTGLPPKEGDKIQDNKQKVQLSADDAKDIARYYVTTGDRSRMQGLGMNGDNKALVNHAITEVKKDLGISDQELAQRTAEFEGSKAGQRTLAVQESKMGSAAFEAEGAIKQARGVIERLPRTSFLPFNKLVEGYQKNTLNPDQTELAGRTQAIINTYAAVMARGANITTDSARGHAEALLNTAGDPATYNRMLDTMLSEITMAKNSPERMRQFYREKMGANSVAPGNSSNPSSTATSSGFTPPAGAIPRQFNGKTYYYDPATKQPYPGQR